MTAALDSTALDYRSRLRGCLLGGALGDALGADIEFLSLGEIRDAHGPDGLSEPPPGELRFTDDTQMTLFTAEGLIRIYSRFNNRGMADENAVLDHAYHRWLRTQGSPTPRWDDFLDAWPGWLVSEQGLHERRAPGGTCLALATAPDIGRLGEEALNDSKGCGAVMRVAPVGFFTPPEYHGDLFTLGCTVGVVTHGHPSGYLAAGALAYLIDRVREGEPLRMALASLETRLLEEDGADEVLQAVRAAQALERTGPPASPEAVESLGAGWVAEEALAIAVYCALASEGFDDPWRRGALLAVNHSGDSDSTGSIAGALLGAIHGEDALPGEWVERLALADVVSTLANDFLTAVGPEPTADWRSEQWLERYPPN